MDNRKLIDTLEMEIGADRVFSRDFFLAGYSDDVIGKVIGEPGRPAVVVAPRTTDEVQKIVKAANRFRISVTPVGGRTECWGSNACDGGILIDTSNMNRITRIDEDSLCVRAQAGCTIQHLDEALIKKGYYYPVHPDNKGISTIGSDVAKCTNGTTQGCYGGIARRLVGLTVVLGNGDILETGTSSVINGPYEFQKDGLPDFTDLFVGAEGCLGIITEVAVSILPLPVKTSYNIAYFKGGEDNVRAMVKAWRELTKRQIACNIYHVDGELSNLIDRTTAHGSAFANPPGGWGGMPLNEKDAGFHVSPVYVTSYVSEKECEIKEAAAREIIIAHGGTFEHFEYDSAYNSQAPQGEFSWNFISYFELAMGKPHFYLWGSVPYRCYADLYYERKKILNAHPDKRLAKISGNLGCCMTAERVVITQAFWPDLSDQTMRESLSEVLKELKAADMKYGYIPYGVGKLYRQELIENLNPTYLEYIRKIKMLFDPNGILNPGNNIF